MADDIIIDGRQAYEEDYARVMSDPDLRALYEHEAQKQELWLRLVEAYKTSGLTPRQMAEWLNVSQAQLACIERAGYDCCTLSTLHHYIEMLDSSKLQKLA